MIEWSFIDGYGIEYLSKSNGKEHTVTFSEQNGWTAKMLISNNAFTLWRLCLSV